MYFVAVTSHDHGFTYFVKLFQITPHTVTTSAITDDEAQLFVGGLRLEVYFSSSDS